MTVTVHAQPAAARHTPPASPTARRVVIRFDAAERRDAATTDGAHSAVMVDALPCTIDFTANMLRRCLLNHTPYMRY